MSRRSSGDAGRETPPRDQSSVEIEIEEKHIGSEGYADRTKIGGENGLENSDVGNRDVPAIKTVAATPSAGDIPDGGLVAWLQVLGGFFILMNSWGVVNTFGVYQTYYESFLATEATPSDIAWIGSIQAFLLMASGLVIGPLYDRGYFHTLIYVGSFLVIFGMMMTSLATHLWHVVLAQGIVIGLGCGSLFFPAAAIIPTYFSLRRSLALGIMASGSSLGGVIYPIIFRTLQPSIGFGWATRVIAFFGLVTLLVPLCVMKVRTKPGNVRKILDISAWKELPFIYCAIALFFGFLGMYVPFFYLQSYAIELGYTDENLGFYMLAIINAGSIFGRIIPNFMADTVGPFNMLAYTSLVAAVLAFVWIGIHNAAGLIVFAALYGFFSGTFVSLPPAAIVSVSPSLDVVGARMGMSFMVASIGLLFGTPIAGAILERGWPSLQAFGGTCVLISSLFMGAARIAKTGWKLRGKA